jgi:hypothetical protein
MRRSACIASLAFNADSFDVILAVIGVRVSPGATQLARIFFGAYLQICEMAWGTDTDTHILTDEFNTNTSIRHSAIRKTLYCVEFEKETRQQTPETRSSQLWLTWQQR